LTNRGIAYRDKGAHDRALVDFDEALRLDPNYAPGYAHRGSTYNLKRDFDRALADFDQAIKRDPKASYFFNDRGRMWRNKGEVERAIADFSEAIRLDPKAAYAFYSRGHAWRAKGDISRALSDFEAVIKVDPTYVAAYTSRGLAYEAKGERDRARADFTTALSLPQKYESGKWAHDTARARLALLEDAPGKRQGKASAAAHVALVIGNGSYKNVPTLANPVNDAEAVAKALREIGFDVLEGTNLDRKRQEQQVNAFLRKASTARVALFFYAGHGMQIDGQNYLIPVDSKLSVSTDLSYEALELAKILNGLYDEARANIVILDACRDNPLAEAGKKGSGVASGLAAVSMVGYGTLIAYATAPDNVALDGAGANSPFTTALLKHIRTPGLEVRQMLTLVRAEVTKITDKKQVPWDNSSLLVDIYLAGRTQSAIR
jgi:tetratricopeptide (TPR) repeat protein